jgi:hypothetical protein
MDSSPLDAKNLEIFWSQTAPAPLTVSHKKKMTIVEVDRLEEPWRVGYKTLYATQETLIRIMV